MLLKFASLSESIPIGVLVQSFLVGMRFDLSIAAYIAAPVSVISYLPRVGLASSPLSRLLARIYLTLMTGVAILMQISDREFYANFNLRLNHLAFEWIESPEMVGIMLWEMFPVGEYLLLLISLVAGFWFLLKYIDKRLFKEIRTVNLRSSLGLYVITLALTFLAIRGRITIKAPLTWGVAYFSSHNFANQLALNPSFTFVQDALIDRKQRTKRNYDFDKIEIESAVQTVRESLDLHPIDSNNREDPHPVARIETNGTIKDLNVMLILGESLASEFISSCGGSEDLAPEFDRLARSGLLFTEFYTSGGHTYTGIFTTVTGLPALPGKSIMKRSEGQQRFAGIATVLKERGYHTRFYTTHDPHFDNMQGFLVSNDVESITGVHDFPPDEVVSSLGVPDEIMYDRVISDLENCSKPFLSILLTGSAHGPFIHPDRPFKHTDPDNPAAQRYNAFSYADWALGRFYDQANETEWGKRTLFVILGDHGVSWNPKYELDPTFVKVPLLFVCPNEIEPGRSDITGGQKDVAASVMQILGGEWVNNTLGESMLKRKRGHAVFIEGRMTGYIERDVYTLKGLDGNTRFWNLQDGSELSDSSINQPDRLRIAQSFLKLTDYMIRNQLVTLPARQQLLPLN